MNRRKMLAATGAAAMLPMLLHQTAAAEGDTTVYELRVYHLNDGKQPLIVERFKKETKIFERCGMRGVAYWTPTEEPLAGKTLIYLMCHKSREAAKESWARFSADPEWIALKAETEKDGAYVKSREVTFLELTGFSPRP